MRITQGMLSNNMLNNLMNSQSKMDKYLEQLYTGKKISRPSDDPVVAMKGMNYRAQVIEVEQFKRNTGEVHNWMDNSDASLDKATKALQRMSELAVQASNTGTQSAEERRSIREEVAQLKEHLIDIANTNVNGKYIFNGTKTDEKPVTLGEDGFLAFTTDTKPVLVEVSKGTKLQANVNPEELFSENLFTDIDSFISKLDGDPTNMDSSIAAIDSNINNIINARADLGARMNRLELIENRLAEQEVIAKKTMSEN